MVENRTIKKDSVPDICPNCGTKTRGSVSCKRCGLYFFRYQENTKNKETPLKGDNSKNKVYSFYNGLLIRLEKIYIFYFIIVIIIVLILIKPDFVMRYFDNPSEVSSTNQLSGALKGKEFFNKGITSGNASDIIGASKHFQTALTEFKKLKNRRYSALTEMNLALCYRILKKYPAAKKSLDYVIRYAVKTGNRKLEAKALRGKGIILFYQGQYDPAIQNLEESFFIHKSHDPKAAVSDCLVMAAIQYENNRDKIKEYIDRALLAAGEINDSNLSYSLSAYINSIGEKELIDIKLRPKPPVFEII